MRTIVKITSVYPVPGTNWTRRNRIVCAGILAAFILGGGITTVYAVVTGHDFVRYQVILDKKPFGEVTPSEVAPPQRINAVKTQIQPVV